jgi:restriction system protein
MKKSPHLPAHVQFFLPIVEALRKLGESATPSELKDTLVEMLQITEEELHEILKTGVSRIDNQVTWSKVYLVREGLLDVSDPNVWSLTEDGLRRQLTEDDVLTIFKRIQRAFVTKKGKRPEVPTPHVETEVEEETAHKAALLGLLKSISPEGFERLSRGCSERQVLKGWRLKAAPATGGSTAKASWKLTR